MNLYKINKSLTEYINNVKDVRVPDVYDLYKKLGKKTVGRNIYKYPNVNQLYFNKSRIHKKFDSYIGKPNIDFYSQDIIKNIIWERRCMCVKGNANAGQCIADKIIKAFGIKDFVFDIYSDFDTKYTNPLLMEVNEICLSSINQEELEFILSNIL